VFYHEPDGEVPSNDGDAGSGENTMSS
jgi:hypothetical protein